MGSGKGEANVRELLKEYRGMKNNLKMMKGNRNFRKLLKSQIKGGDFSLDNMGLDTK